VHREGAVLVFAAEGDLLAGDMITPVFDARRWTVIGSVEGLGTDPTGRQRCSVVASPGSSGLGRVRSSSRVSRSKNSSGQPSSM
jgi:hypothetical protein